MEVETTPQILDLAHEGAWFAFSVSGGKDSGASLSAANRWLDSIGHPRERRLALHADLGRAEWPDTIDTVRAVCAHQRVPLEVVASRNDLVWRFEDRWRRSLQRYVALETISLVPPWSSSSLLFCRSEQKSSVLSRRKARLPGGLPVVGVVGLRREESTRRALTPTCCADGDMIRRNGREGLLWHPIAHWSTKRVFDEHAEHGIPLHRAYGLGSTRLSCAYCVLGSRGDIATSFGPGGNMAAFLAYSSLELRSAFSFQAAAWLSDLGGPDLVPPALLAEARGMAAERNAHQQRLPRPLLRAKSIRNINPEDAATLAAVRRSIAELYGIGAIGTTADEVLQLARGDKDA